MGISGYGEIQRAPAQKSADGGAADRRSEPAREHASAGDPLAASLNHSPSAQSLLQLRAALDESSRVRSLLALQRALDPASATGDEQVRGGGVLYHAEHSANDDLDHLQSHGDVIQRAMKYGNAVDVSGKEGEPLHYHHSYDDANINSLHVTFCDTQNYNNRTWASRTSYTPNGYDWQANEPTGNWAAVQHSQHGQTPAWAQNLIANRLAAARTAGWQAYAADNNIITRLKTQYPQPVPTATDFPTLGAH